jgi:hypothetical protein
MIDVRIVCTHDAIKLAEMLTRLLEAEQHRVRFTYGRQSLSELEDARGARDAVLLIWSPNARSQVYMIEWARKIDPSRLVELALGTTDWPAVKRLSPVIDFTNWQGARGARAWKALNERLHAVTRVFEPPQPMSARTLLTAGMATAAAAAGIVVMNANPPAVKDIATAVPLEDVALVDPSAGMGGPLSAIEPASLDDEVLRLRHYPELAPLAEDSAPLPHPVEYDEVELRDPTLLERLDSINPLRVLNDDEAPQ